MSRETPWKSMASALYSGAEVPYVEHLRAKVEPAAALQQIEKEIVAEMANALGRSQDKVKVALARLAEAGQAVDAAPDGPVRQACVARFNELRTVALRLRRDLLIHREAIGFRRNDHLEREYPVPPKRA
jgi:hypothetical protein